MAPWCFALWPHLRLAVISCAPRSMCSFVRCSLVRLSVPVFHVLFGAEPLSVFSRALRSLHLTAFPVLSRTPLFALPCSLYLLLSRTSQVRLAVFTTSSSPLMETSVHLRLCRLLVRCSTCAFLPTRFGAPADSSKCRWPSLEVFPSPALTVLSRAPRGAIT